MPRTTETGHKNLIRNLRADEYNRMISETTHIDGGTLHWVVSNDGSKLIRVFVPN